MSNDSQPVVDNPRGFVTEQQLPEFYQQQINEFWRATAEYKNFSGVHGVNIFYAVLDNPKSDKLILLCGGLTECAVKYKELCYEFFQQGYSVITLDHRGQGFSQRLVENKHQAYVDQFEYFVADVSQLYQLEIADHRAEQKFIVGHSMGGAITATYILNYPQHFDKAVLASPMLGFATPVPESLMRGLASLLYKCNKLFSKQPWYFLGESDFTVTAFEENVLTHSPSRYQLFVNEYLQQPEVQLGGVTLHWINQAIAAVDNLQSNAHKVTTPFVLLQSGSDKLVNNAGQNNFCRLAPGCVDGQPFTVEGAYHELFTECDEHRIPALNRLFDFLQSSRIHKS